MVVNVEVVVEDVVVVVDIGDVVVETMVDVEVDCRVMVLEVDVVVSCSGISTHPLSKTTKTSPRARHFLIVDYYITKNKKSNENSG